MGQRIGIRSESDEGGEQGGKDDIRILLKKSHGRGKGGVKGKRNFGLGQEGGGRSYMKGRISVGQGLVVNGKEGGWARMLQE